MIHERLSASDAANGALLDGFPRTPAQAAALDEMLAVFGGEVDAVPLIKVAEETLIERLTGRWTCRASRAYLSRKVQPSRAARHLRLRWLRAVPA
jgi:adenylate kinase